MQVDLKVSQLLCSRLCHDIVGPSGAIHNGMELLDESGLDNGGDALALVSDSVGQLSARLAFYRLAFGYGGLSGSKPALFEAHDLAANFLGHGRVTLNWPIDQISGPQQDLPVATAKLLLNMILVAVDALPRGGSLGVSIARLSETGENAGTGMAIKASGTSAAIKDDLLAVMSTGPQDEITNLLSAHNVHGYFCQKLAQSLGGEVELSITEQEIQLAVLVPDQMER